MHPAWRNIALGAIAGALLFATAACGVGLLWPGIDLDFGDRGPQPYPITRGLDPAEQMPDGRSFAWSGPQARFRIDPISRSTAWQVVVDLSTSRPAGHARPDIAVLSDQQPLLTWTAKGNGFEPLAFTIPAAPERDSLNLTLAASNTFTPPNDPRALGFMIDRIRLVPDSAWAGLPWRSIATLALVGAMLGALAAGVTLLWAALAITAALAIATALLQVYASAWYLKFTDISIDAALIAVAIALVSIVVARPIAWASRLAICVAASLLYLKLLLILHPAMTLGDSVFHFNRFKLVLGGQYFFTSTAPGGDFPYPVSFYVVTRTLGWRGVSWIPLMRTIALITDTVSALLLGAAVTRAWKQPLAGLLAVVLVEVSPALFQVQAVAYLTNAFGNSAAVAAIACLLLAAYGAGVMAIVAGVAAIALTAVALLAHVSSCLILVGTLVMIAGVALLQRRQPPASALLRWSVAALVIGAGLAYGLYYRHFGDTYRRIWDNVGQHRVAAAAPATPATPAALPIQRAEAHQTVYVPGWPALAQRAGAVPGYLRKYFGVVQSTLAIAGAVLLCRRRPIDVATTVLLAWIGACVIFLVFAMVTPIDLRYYLAASPAVAVLAAVTVQQLLLANWKRARLIGIALLTIVFVSGVTYALAFYSLVLPR